MRVAASLFALLLSIALFALWALVGIVRVANCGPAEGGGSCSPSADSWLLLAGAVAAAISAVVVLVLRRRR
jgi:LPXTG-motif cell wall-anchored protein